MYSKNTNLFGNHYHDYIIVMIVIWLDYEQVNEKISLLFYSNEKYTYRK